MKLKIVTGMSGAGMTLVLNFFEDRGYTKIDNLPCFVLETLKLSLFKEKSEKLAVGIDIRSFESVKEFTDILDRLVGREDIKLEIIYLTAKTSTLLNRFNLTRRKHPLKEKFSSLEEAIERERVLLQEIKRRATSEIDTTEYKPKKLVEFLSQKYSKENLKDLHLSFTSFGFKYGSPIDNDLIFDVRCLPNPYYDENLRPKTGNSLDVQDYVMSIEESHEYLKKIIDMIEFTIPLFKKDGRSSLSVGIGCSGGQHRSVTFVNRLTEHFKNDSTLLVLKQHREEEKW